MASAFWPGHTATYQRDGQREVERSCGLLHYHIRCQPLPCEYHPLFFSLNTKNGQLYLSTSLVSQLPGSTIKRSNWTQLCGPQGSVMFLFESTSGRVLHTGDFRCCFWCCQPLTAVCLHELTHCVRHHGEGEDCYRLGAAEQRAIMQHPATLSAPINLLVLDNTYCNPRYAALHRKKTPHGQASA